MGKMAQATAAHPVRYIRQSHHLRFASFAEQSASFGAFGDDSNFGELDATDSHALIGRADDSGFPVPAIAAEEDG
jgi:hypothetical protein